MIFKLTPVGVLFSLIDWLMFQLRLRIGWLKRARLDH